MQIVSQIRCLLLIVLLAPVSGLRGQVPEIMISNGHAGPIEDVCYSHDEKWVATLSQNEIKIWDSRSGRELRTLTLDGSGFPRRILFTPDNTHLIIGKFDTEGINVVEITSGRLRKVEISASFGFEFVDMAIAPDGRHLAVTTIKSLLLLQLPSFSLIKTVSIPGIIRGLAFNDATGEVLVGVSNGLVATYRMADGKLTRGNLPHTVRPLKVVFAPQRGQLLCANTDYSIDLWNIDEKRLNKTVYKPEFAYPAIGMDPVTGRLIIGGTRDKMARLYPPMGEGPALLGPHHSEVQFVQFSPSGKSVVTTTSDWSSRSERHGLQSWDAATGQSGLTFGVGFLQPEILSCSDELMTFRMGDQWVSWNLRSNEMKSVNAPENSRSLPMVRGDTLYTLNLVSPGKYAIQNVVSGRNVLNFDLDVMPSMKTEFWISPHGDVAVVSGLKYYLPEKAEEIIKVFSLQSGRLLKEFVNQKEDLMDRVLFINDGAALCFLSSDFSRERVTLRTWNLVTGTWAPVMNLGLSSRIAEWDGRSLLVLSQKGARQRNMLTGENTPVKFPVDSFFQKRVSSSPFLHRNLLGYFLPSTYASSLNILAIADGRHVKVVDLSQGKIMHSLEHADRVDGMYLVNSDTVLAVGTNNGMVNYWNLRTGKKLIGLISLSTSDWLVKAPGGLFDGSPGAMEQLYFVKDLEIIELAQLKERYFEPGLLSKVMGGEILRSTLGFNAIDLPPEVMVGQVDDRGYLPIDLKNRGGGIGEVTVYIQGKEVIRDAREKNANPDASSMRINYYVGNHKNLVKGENVIGVKAWNKEHWVESRSTVVSYRKEGAEDQYRPSVHIMTCGVSDYAGGSDIDLAYAAKDAGDVSRALTLGASRLFGTQKSYVYNLTTAQSREFWPTKTNIRQAFDRISSTAHPLDVIVVYFSGHGVNIGGAEGDWYYLTQEAFTPNPTAYQDPKLRQEITISSTELVEAFKNIPAAKQVLIIDACASGRVVDDLAVERNVPSNTLRALDRLKDRTGMHILTGCAADAVSYEASRYGQGVLTYSLLEGIRGAALRDEEFVDVNRLFQYAQERVPVLATGIGGIQTPVVFSPRGSQSFDIGQLTEAEKGQVPISNIRPVYIQSNFQDEDEMADLLGLGRKVDQLLGESAAKGVDAPWIFVPVRDYPGGCQLMGRYRRGSSGYLLRLRKRCEGEDATMEFVGADASELGLKVLQWVNR